MPRKRNEQFEQAIHAAARKIMLERGYEETTYTALAQATGIARTTIQHYVPYKEALATELMQAISDLAYREASSMLTPDANPFAKTYFAGLISHAMYYSTPGLRRFLLDISTDRRLQYQIPPDYTAIALDSLGVDESLLEPGCRDLMVHALGGVYDVHFVCLREGRFLDTRRVNETVLRVYARATGRSESLVDDLVANYDIEQGELMEIAARLVAELGKEPAADADE